MFGGEAAGEELKRIDRWEQSLGRRAEEARELAGRTAELTATAADRIRNTR